VRFEVFTAVKIKFSVSWFGAPCSVVVGYQHFRGPHFLHLEGSAQNMETATNKKTTNST
jgi:hypothetical protein